MSDTAAAPAKTESRLMFIHAETPLHPGTGSALGAVDLPVARERHTDWPYIPASSIKGVLRDKCRDANGKENADLFLVFGPDTDNASDHAGALSLTDARLLAFPVRSLRGLFAWVTCPAALKRLQKDAEMAGEKEKLGGAVQKLLTAAGEWDADDVKALVPTNSPLLIPNTSGSSTNMVLEEFDYKAGASEHVKKLGEELDAFCGGGTRMATHLAVVSDNAFTHYVRFATEVMARIAIDSATKTVKQGHLFYEEFLPAGVVFYSLAITTDSLNNKKEDAVSKSATEILKYLRTKLGAAGAVQIGGNATTGKGLCTLVMTGERNNA